jgi:hypothetical protein
MTKTVAYKMMTGTSGYQDYLAFARKGNVVLGVKPLGFDNGGKHGVPGTTLFAANLRSAPAGSLFDDDEPQKVVKLVKDPDNFGDAWPEVTWSKKDHKRASTVISSFMPGTMNGTPDEQQKLFEEIDQGKIAGKMAAYLVGLAGKGNLILTEKQLSAWIDEQYKPLIAKVKLAIEQAKKVQEAIKSNVGTFGMQAAILKKVFDEMHPGHDKAEDIEEESGDEVPNFEDDSET